MEPTLNLSDLAESKRRFMRAEYSLPMKYKNLRSIGEMSIGSLTRDISEGGVRFKTDKFISLACRLVLEISLPTAAKPVKAISKVAWIRKGLVGDSYDIGNQFLEITREDKAVIREFVNNIKEKKS